MLQVWQMFCQTLGKSHSADTSLSPKRMRRGEEEWIDIDFVTHSITCKVEK